MELVEIIQRYEELFKDDPLYQYIQKNKALYEELIKNAEIYNEVYFDTTCSTVQAASVLGIKGKQQTLLNFLGREDFQDYFNIERKGERGYYRFDYKALFQFKMILLLTGNQLSPLDIATLIGTTATYRYSDKPIRKPHDTTQVSTMDEDKVNEIVNDLVDEKFDEFMNLTKKFFVNQMEKQQMVNNIKLQELQLENDLKHWENDMKHNGQQIELIEKQIDSLTLRPELEQSFFSKLFGIQLNSKSQENVELLKELNEIKEKLIEDRKSIESNKIKISKELDSKSQEFLQALKENKADEQNTNSEIKEKTLSLTAATVDNYEK